MTKNRKSPTKAIVKKRQNEKKKKRKSRRQSLNNGSLPTVDLLPLIAGHLFAAFIRDMCPFPNSRQSQQPKQKQLEANNVIDITDYKVS